MQANASIILYLNPDANPESPRGDETHLEVSVSGRANADAGVEVGSVGLAPCQHVQVSHLRREAAGFRVPRAVVLAGVPQRIQVALVDGGGTRRLIPRASL